MLDLTVSNKIKLRLYVQETKQLMRVTTLAVFFSLDFVFKGHS